MEIEKKYLLNYLPEGLEKLPKKEIEQGYLCRNPVVRIRKSNEDYILTYKSKFGLENTEKKDFRINREVEVPLHAEGYAHLKGKIDDYMVQKTRYLFPLDGGLTAEIDVFHGILEGLRLVEVEFPDEEQAGRFLPPDWFGEHVSGDERYSNSYLSTLDSLDCL